MNNKIAISPFLKVIFVPILALLVFTFLVTPKNANAEDVNALPTVAQVKSIDALGVFFKKIGYPETAWKNAKKAIPRVVFDGITNNWARQLNKLSTKSKKSLFFRLMTPLILISNENILIERDIVKTATLDSKSLFDIAVKYRILDSESQQTNLTEAQRELLLERVDIVPVSLAVVQAAKETGWGTSRFAREGNAFFGQWDFTGQGMKPLLQRQELGNYTIATFNSPLASVEGYMLNLNSNEAYSEMRILRAKLRVNNSSIKGVELTPTLDKYSETGAVYTQEIKKMIQFNELQTLDSLTLSEKPIIHLKNQ